MNSDVNLAVIFAVRLHVMQCTVLPGPLCPSNCQTRIVTKRK